MSRQKQIAALAALLDAIVDAVKAAGPLGAPGGHLYAPLMGTCTADQFGQLMGALVIAGRVTRDGEVYHATARTVLN